MLNPLTRPMMPPNTIVPSTPSGHGKPQFTIITPDITAHSAIPVPMLRSMPPVMITNVVPRASVPITTVAYRIASTLP
jgi:hypothetical protein